jgi:hypothetical protein
MPEVLTLQYPAAGAAGAAKITKASVESVAAADIVVWIDFIGLYDTPCFCRLHSCVDVRGIGRAKNETHYFRQNGQCGSGASARWRAKQKALPPAFRHQEPDGGARAAWADAKANPATISKAQMRTLQKALRPQAAAERSHGGSQRHQV